MSETIRKISSPKGELTVPGDKSISHRGVILGAVSEGVSEISGFLFGADCLSTIDCFRKMGVSCEISGERVKVHGRELRGLLAPGQTLYTGNSGTTTRLLAGLLAGQSFSAVIDGDSSIRRRPMKRVTKPLSMMGADISGDFCPLKINGRKLHGIDYKMEVASAQVKTAIMLAALYADSPTVIHEVEQSRNHTELMLSAAGADIAVNGLDITVNPAQRLSAQCFEVPGDISSAAFFLVLGLIMPNAEITVRNVGLNPTRTGIIDVLLKMGADIAIENRRTSSGEEAGDITVRSSSLHGCRIGGADIPRLIDEIPIIAAAALFAEGTTVIQDAEELKVKESNRIRAVCREFAKTGADIEETEDGMIINGGRPLHGADFVTEGDHRMAMTAAVLAQMLEGQSTIDDPGCAAVSYPQFFDRLYGLG